MKTKKILIVDDQEMIRKLVKMTLATTEFDVVEAINGSAAIQAAQLHKPDLIILDVMMPGGLNGIEACAALRGLEEFAETPILMLSAKTQQIDKEEGMNAGATDYLSKPFSPEYLIKMIKEYIEN